MPALYVLIPAAIILVSIAIWIFFWAVDNGQYDDLESPAHSILFDDEDYPRESELKKTDQKINDKSLPTDIDQNG